MGTRCCGGRGAVISLEEVPEGIREWEEVAIPLCRKGKENFSPAPTPLCKDPGAWRLRAERVFSAFILETKSSLDSICSTQEGSIIFS